MADNTSTGGVSFGSNHTSVSGVFGDHSKTKAIKGWEQYTTAIGGDVGIRLGHSQGVASFDHNTVSIDEPLRLGRFIGVWLRTPPFFNSEVKKYFNYFFQDKILEFSGLNDNEVSAMSRTMGAVGREESYAGSYKETNGKFQLKIPEVKGSPVRKIMKYYVCGISDPVTGTAHFHGNKNLRFSKINYSGDFLYILLGPTMRPDDIEFCALYLNAFPTKEFISHLNSGAIGEPGDANQVFDVEFNGTYVQNDEVTKLAMKVVEAFGLYKDTVEDVILPSYIYENYLAATSSADLLSKAKGVGALMGNDIKSKLDQLNKTTNTEITDTGDYAGRTTNGPTIDLTGLVDSAVEPHVQPTFTTSA